jgi:phosphate transport system ATP-binding protein
MIEESKSAPPSASERLDGDRLSFVVAAKTPDSPARGSEETCLDIENLSLYYDDQRALADITMKVPRQRVTAFIGPSGCGKSTLLRCFNRMNDLIDSVRITGAIRLHGQNINDSDIDVAQLRRKVGMVFQRPNPFPKTIYENVAYGLRLEGTMPKGEMDDRVEWALKSAALWDEVKNRLKDTALGLSGGQQQRLVIARSIAIEPEVLLLDEPASALDPISTLKIEELVHQLKSDYTIVIVTHNMQQAARVSDYTAFLYLGELIEFNDTQRVFTNPQKQQTEDYITGRYG